MKKLLALLLIITTSSLGFAQKLDKTFDKMFNAQYPANEPGATVLVAKAGKIVYHKAFGMANMELGVKMQPNNVLEIASITKQFTAVAVLMLVEQGKINLDDDITKFIKDYPTHGHTITVHHLLTHTSGIKSYTSMKGWRELWRKDFTPTEMIDFFKNEPMNFAPGEAYSYNNSAYFMLGYIIEKASGQTYEEFVETNIFGALGMKSSRYCSNSEIIKNRASGYQKKKDVYVNADYLSMSQPYSAGSLMSTVEDYFLWNRAIRNNTLIKKESKALAFTNYKLNNGEATDYGYGWGFDEIFGSPTIEHSGGIFGFSTKQIYLPTEDVLVVLFSNNDSKPSGQLAIKMAAIAVGKPFPTKEDAITVKTEELKKFVGVYEFDDKSIRYITLEDNQLYSLKKGSERFKIFPIKKNTFTYEDNFANIEFVENGKEIKAFMTSRSYKAEGVKTDKALPTNKEVNVATKTLERYLGVYEMQPNFDLTVTLDGDQLMVQVTGQPIIQVYPESQTKFFLKVIDAQIEFFANDKGVFDSFILYQNGQKVPGKKK